MRHLLLVLPFALLAGCVVRTYPATYSSAPAPAPRAEVHYYGNHFIPDDAGGGWCYIDGPHAHDYYPDNDDYYDYDQGYLWYRGPFQFAFFGGHPLPGGGWCFLNGPHHHDYYPPSGSDWRWSRTGYVYSGHYRPDRPPPSGYWVRPAPRQDWRSGRPSVRPAPGPARRPSRFEVRPPPGGGPDRDRDVRPPPGGAFDRDRDRDRDTRQVPALFDRDRDRDDRRPGPDARPGHSGDAPGHGALPPGQGGTPPGQVGRDDAKPDRDNGFPGRGRPEAAPIREEKPERRGGFMVPSRGDDDKDKDKREQKKKKEEKKDDDKDDKRLAPMRRR